MRYLLSFILIVSLVGSATAIDLGSFQKDLKNNNHVGMNPGTPDGRQGGEDMSTAFIINALPFSDTGNTVNNIDDYDVMCPYGSNSPDVVYSFTPTHDELVRIDLCGSSYDTKVYVMDEFLQVIACNDDYYFQGDPCGTYVSLIEGAELIGGIEYFIIVDGYGGDSGDYILEIIGIQTPEPCILTCDGVPEGEPALGPDYDDFFNSGCGGPDAPFQELIADSNGQLVFCGVSGWYDNAGLDYRDTDWFTAIIGELGTIEWILDAEQETYAMLLGPNNCNDVAPIESIIAGPCSPATLLIQGNAGEVVWLWVGPTDFFSPLGFEGYEYNYVSTYTGLFAGVVATENVSFGSIKSLYR